MKPWDYWSFLGCIRNCIYFRLGFDDKYVFDACL